MTSDPTIFAMVCEQRDAAYRELAAYREVVVPKPDYDRLLMENHRLLTVLDAVTKQAQDAEDKRARRALEAGTRAVLAYVRLHERHTYAPDEMPRVNAVRAWLVENGARLHGDEAVYAAAEAHGTAVRR